MSSPYVTTRTGRFQWTMQRVSAALLIIIAFVHFSMQHFTADAVTTGLTVAARMNDPGFQAFYIIFVVLGLYHGLNGLVGIMHDYAPKPLVRGVLATIIWTFGAAFTIVGVVNVVTPLSVNELKQDYATTGFAHGVSYGNPPAAGIEYDLRQPLRELGMLQFYLLHHTHRTDADAKPVNEIFAGSGDDSDAGLAQSSVAFNEWASDDALATAADAERDESNIFASTKEFAVWALHVRLANATSRLESAQAAEDADAIAKANDAVKRLQALVNTVGPYHPDLL